MKVRPDTYSLLGFDDSWLRIIGIPLVGFIFPLLFFDRSLAEGWSYIPKWILATVHTALYWEGTRFITIKFRKAYPTFSETRKRLWGQVPIVILYTALISVYLGELICSPIEWVFGLNPHEGPPFTGIAAAYITVLLWSAIYENIYFYYQLKQSLLEKEQAKQDHIRSQLEGLRNQVNPHFLFNSLNTLMNIIAEDQKLAIRYLKKMSKVYRYMLDIRKEELIPLSEELDFIHAYVFLQEERFKGNLEVICDIPLEYMDYKIVPLSLQILFENAIKHNIISSKRPLTIRVFINGDGKIVVQNNLQRKNQIMPSTKVGLENVKNRYRLVTSEAVEVEDKEPFFTVALPLIFLAKPVHAFT